MGMDGNMSTDDAKRVTGKRKEVQNSGFWRSRTCGTFKNGNGLGWTHDERLSVLLFFSLKYLCKRSSSSPTILIIFDK